MFYKIVQDGYIIVVGTGNGGEPITAEEYERIRSAILNAPTAEIGYEYLLREDLTWELVEVPVVDPAEEEISGNELLSMIEEVL